MHHATYTSLTEVSLAPWMKAISEFFHDGNLGVDLFFVLSGYLITTLLLKDRRSPSLYRDFYIKRVFRILPALLAALAIGWATHYLSTATVLLSLLFVVNYATALHVPTTGPFWSLAVEEQFYIFWPTIVRNVSIRNLHRIVWAIVLVEPLLRFWSVKHGHGTMYYTHLRADSLAWGAWLGASTFTHRIYSSPERASAWWNRYGRWTLGAGVVAAIAHVVANRQGLLGDQANTSMFTVSPIVFAGLIAYLVTHPKVSLARALSWRPIAFFGDISYGLYLIHMTVIAVYDRVTGLGHVPLTTSGYLVRLATIVAVSVGLAALSLYRFERPLMRLRSRFLTKRPTPVSGTAVPS